MSIDSEFYRRAVAVHRHEAGFGEGRRDRLRESIRSSIDAGEAERLAAALEADEGRPSGIVIEPAAPSRRRAFVAAAVILLALGGAALSYFGSLAGRGEQDAGAGEAAYMVEPQEIRQSDVRGRAEVIESRAPEVLTPEASPAPAERDESEASTPAPAKTMARRGKTKAKPKPPAESQASPASPETLSAELKLIRSARAALNAGDLQRSLRLLDTHRERFPHGQLEPEREAYRVELLCRLDATRGRKARTAFTQAFPGSRHRARVEAASCEGP